MTLGYGISEIGYSPLGRLGLDSNCTYSSYDYCMPTMMGMNSSLFGANPMIGMGGYGMMNPMMGMYNPMFMAQMQQQMEASQAIHAGNMHNLVLNNEVQAHRETDSALIQKMITNGDIQQGIQNLHNKIIEGDQNGICDEFDKLKKYVYNTYKDELAARGDKINPSVSATQYIEAVYSSVISAQTGKVADLRSDIKTHGDTALQNGFMSGFRRGHHTKYVDETLQHCFGLRIDHKDSKDTRQTIGKGVGRAASVLEKGVYGAAGGVAATGLVAGLAKMFCPRKVSWLKWMKGAAYPALVIGAGLGMIGDIIWQASKN